MKRISITNSKELDQFLNENGPTMGAIKAFQFGADVWISVSVKGETTTWSDKKLLAKAIQRFKDCHRIAMFFSEYDIFGPEKKEVRLEILGYDNQNKNPTGMMIAYFQHKTGEVRN